MIKKRLQSALSLIALGTLLFSTSVMAAGPGGGSTTPPDTCQTDCGYERGPDPSDRFLEDRRGHLSVRTERVSGLVSGFGGGTIHYPVGTSGTMGAVVVIPGFVSAESSIDWWGPKLASYGFVVMTIDTNTGFDQPPSRARQINAALDYLIEQNSDATSPIRGMVDTDRLGVIGWSMGGGGTLRVASEGRLSAAIPLAPWDTSSFQFRDIQTPTMIFACGADVIAPVALHASPFYNAIPESTPKAFVKIGLGTHYCGNGGNLYNDVLGRLGVAWMKLHMDKDERYARFICGPRHEQDLNISEYRGNCR